MVRSWLLATAMAFVLALAARTAPAGAPVNVAEWAAAYAAPLIGGAGVDAAGRTLAFGHLELKLKTGGLYPVVVGERIAGVYFRGSGEFRYVSKDQLEAASYASNVRRSSSYTIDKNGAIGDTVTAALVMLSSGAEDIVGPAAVKPADSPAAGEFAGAARLAFTGHLERFAKDQMLRYNQIMPQAMIDPPAKPVVVAEIVADKHDLVYWLDPMRHGDEDLSVMERVKDALSYVKGRRYAESLSEHPVGRGRLDPRPRRFMLTAVDLSLTNSEGMRCELEVKETFVAIAPLRVIDLGLWDKVFVSKGPTGAIAEPTYELRSVSIPGGPAPSYARVADQVLVELPKPLAAGESVTIAFTIAGDVLYRPGGDTYWELGPGAWLPVPGRWDQMAATYHGVVKVAKPFVPFSCGQTVRRWQEGELECAEFREEKPIERIAILAGRYTTTSEERNGVTVRVSAYAIAKPKGVKKLMDLAFGFMEFYRPYLGDYPFKELNIIEINSYGFGQAPPGIIFITKEAFNPMLEETSRLFSDGINSRVAHELAHAWWGHVAKLNWPEDQWLSESVAQYYAAYAMQQLGGERWFTQAKNEWKTWAAFLKDQGTVYSANYLSGDEAGDDRAGLLYGKGAMMLHALRQEIGDQAFFTILKSFVKSFYFKPATTRNFIDLTNFVTKKDNTAWFDRYLFGTEWPKL